MASIDYPDNLRLYVNGSLRETRRSAIARDESQTGAPRRRRRFTRDLAGFEFALVMDDAQAAAFRQFVRVTTDGGAEAFNWTHPVTGTAYEMAFAEEPLIDAITVGAWRAQVRLEEI